jgi:hypothetical protein
MHYFVYANYMLVVTNLIFSFYRRMFLICKFQKTPVKVLPHFYFW